MILAVNKKPPSKIIRTAAIAAGIPLPVNVSSMRSVIEVSVAHSQNLQYETRHNDRTIQREVTKRTARKEFRTQNEKGVSQRLTPFNILVGRAGFEPATNGLKVRCSTN